MNKETQLKLQEWVDAAGDLVSLKAKEALLRKELFDEFFPKPKEGTNTADLDNGWKVKGTYKLNRNIDKAALPAVLKLMEEGSEDTLINYKPELKAKAYKSLEAKAKKIFDEVLTTKPGTPTLELKAPK